MTEPWKDTSGWTKDSGYSFGVFEEKHTLSETLPIEPIPTDTTVTFNIISGKLPPGVRLTDTTIWGTPYEVIRTTQFTFCIRATVNNSTVYDRTFYITVEGSDKPEFLTPSGTLAIGANNQLYILDQSVVTYQIETVDSDTSAGQILEYYVSNGELPPGLTLSKSGLISGLIDPALAVKLTDGSGGYDSGVYDGLTYDFSGSTTITDLSGTILYNGSQWLLTDTISYNLRAGMTLTKVSGVGTFGANTRINEILYDDVVSLTFDTPPSSGHINYYAQSNGNLPRRINRNYEFEVSVSDGDNVTTRIFKIFVVGEDFFTADNEYWTVDNTLFTSDATSLKRPTWVTSPYLGIYRGDNYQTFILDVYGNISYYSLEPVNATKIGTTDQATNIDNILNSYSLTLTSDTIPQLLEWVSFTKEYYIRSWAAGTWFSVGDLVQYNNAVYICNITHISSIDPDDVETELNSIKWKLKTNTWKIENDYTINDVIVYNSLTYICVSSHHSQNVSELNDTTKWKLYPSTECYKILQVTSLGVNRYRLTLENPLQVNYTDGIKCYIGSLSQLPPGMSLDTKTGEVYGYIPYQTKTKISYTFTISGNNVSNIGERASSARQFIVDIIGVIDSTITWVTPANLGFIEANYTSLLSVVATSTLSSVIYTLESGTLPPGLSLTPNGELIGKVTQFGNRTSNQTTYDVLLNDETTFDRDQMTNDVDMRIITYFDNHHTGFDNNTTIFDSDYSYNCIQYGLTRFDPNLDTLFDSNETTFDLQYSFTIKASDVSNYSSVLKTFYLTVITPYNKIYSNIHTPLLLPLNQRKIWDEFVHNQNVFTPSKLFRYPLDLEFGIPVTNQMLIYGGIETVEAAKYVSMMNNNNKKKRFTFGSVKHAFAILSGTNTVVYEVIYVEIFDQLEPNGKHLPIQLTNVGLNSETITVDSSNIFYSRDIDHLSDPAPFCPRPNMNISMDSTGYFASNSNISTYYPNSITNWRNNIRNWAGGVETERNYLPLWMRSIQPGSKAELGFILAVPLCYCNPGMGIDILNNINYYMNSNNFTFSQFDFVADRYIITPAQQQCNNITRYYVFNNQRITV